MPPDQDAGTLGILAGGGPLPIHIAAACKTRGRACFTVVFEGQGDPDDFRDLPHAVMRIGAAGAVIKRLRAEGCETVVLSGTIHRAKAMAVAPDWWAIKFLAKTGAGKLGDDGLLSALIRALEGEGFAVVGAESLVPELLMPRGVLGAVVPAEAQRGEIGAAVAAARALGARDAGQAAVVRDGQVIAEEDAAGTDAMLNGLAAAENRGGVLAKTLKPDQERRADLPTVGVRTVENAHRAGLAGIAVEAGNAFLIDRADAVARADALGLFLVGVDANGDVP